MADENKPYFEEALGQIELIVADLERGEPSLSSALVKYETGVKLLRQCYQLLEEAEQSVALLTGTDDQGNPETIPFDATATFARERGVAPSPGMAGSKSKKSERNSSPKATFIAPDDSSDIPEPPF